VRIEWNPVYKHFIEFIFVETNEVVRSNSNVILTRQTCGQRSSRVAGSKHRALAFYFSIRIWHMFSISKCRGKSDLDRCMTSIFANGMRLPSTNIRFQNVFGRRIRWVVNNPTNSAAKHVRCCVLKHFVY